MNRRAFLVSSSFAALAQPALAATTIRFVTDWKAQAEHGGFYQAVAEGLYAKRGLEGKIIQGGPIKAGMAIFQKDPQVLMSHPPRDINSLADMKGKPVLISAATMNAFWP